MEIRYPKYYENFVCLADRCPDSCCKEWSVDVDAASALFYRNLPGSLGDRLRQELKETDDGVSMVLENGRCPMWRQDGLCRIQAELGHDALCAVCREFPRLRHDYGSFTELGLELSCPEAARLILTAPWEPSVVTITPENSEPEYDTEAMALLLPARQQALSLLETPHIGSALALLLIFGYHTQSVLDDAEPVSFNPAAALEECRDFAKPADLTALPRFFADLEILTNEWRSRLITPTPAPWSEPIRNLARYGIDRYWLQAVCDYDLIGRVKMVIVSCLLVKQLGGDPIATAQLYSKEIENNPDNVAAILDAAYGHPAFTDDKLLWLLLNEEHKDVTF